MNRQIQLPLDIKLWKQEHIQLLNDVLSNLVYTLPIHDKLGQSVPGANFLRNGMLAYADGTNWEPVKGAGLHRYDGSAWRQLNGYHDRGDPSAFDFTITDFTTDYTWRDLDLSSIVPAGTKAVFFRLSINDDATGSVISFRKNGNSNEYAVPTLSTQVVDLTNFGNMIVPCGTDLKIEYRATNTTWTGINVLICGWWV